jgi:3-demethoxyubiquinol 3-hydroxylase
MRNFSTFDRALATVDNALTTLFAAPQASRATPHTPEAGAKPELTQQERHAAGALMRVNHVGEVCAQALYQGQALATRDEHERQWLLAAAREEADHLAWCDTRLNELGARKSLLNPLWYAGSLALGVAAARMDNKLGLGFVVETERQVEAHLQSHLDKLPAHDHASRAIVAQMRADEQAHGDAAQAAGAAELPLPARFAMKAVAKLMTSTAHYV